jgi:hypothetical protein
MRLNHFNPAHYLKKVPMFQKTLLLFILAVFIISALPAVAQLSVGVEGGFNKNYLITNNANRAFTNYKPLNGFTVGIPIQYKIADWFAIATDVEFLQKNYRQERSKFFEGVYQNNYNSYIQLPLMAHFMFGGKRLQGFTNAGMFGGYWASSRIKGELPAVLNEVDNTTSTSSIYDYFNAYSYNENYSFDTRKDNRFEAGWIAGLGLSYNLNEHYQIFAEGRLLYSFTDQQKNYETNQVPRYNTTYGIKAGILFSFKNKKTSY